MPNHCNNTVTISGKTEDVKKVLSIVSTKDNPFDFDAIVPYPKKFKDQDQFANDYEAKHGFQERIKNNIVDGYNNGGYDWCVSNWGTKWNSYDHSNDQFDVVESGDHTTATLSFLTAWSPPIGVMEQLVELFPDLDITLEYHELGMNYRGQFDGDSGDQSWEITDDDLAELGYDDIIEDEDEDEEQETV